MRSAIRTVFTALLASAVGSAPAFAEADRWAGDGGISPFYDWSKPVPRQPGRMLRTAPAPADVSLPDAGRAERILYSSTDWRDAGRAIPVSGIVFFPKGKAPKGGWPVIAWAHGTTGVADVCAPSFMPRSERDAAYFGYWLKAGYAIVATDYQGLGEPGVHPYLHYRAEGIGVLDSIRAALARYPELSRDKIITMGQSQGSEGAIAAAYLAPSYAPEIRLKGTVATGIVAQTRNVGTAAQVPPPPLYEDDANYGNSAYEVMWFLGTAHGSEPQKIRPEDYISEAGWPMVTKAQTTCGGGLFAYARAIKLPMSKFYKQPIDQLEAALSPTVDFPVVAIRTPVFVGTGLADSDAQPAKQYNFTSAMCAAGTRVEQHYYPHATHGGAVARSLADSPAFVAKVMRGETVAGNCAALQPPGPIQTAG